MLSISLIAMSPYWPTSPVSMDFELSNLSTVCLVRVEKLENPRRYEITCALGSGAGSDIVVVDIFTVISKGLFIKVSDLDVRKNRAVIMSG